MVLGVPGTAKDGADETATSAPENILEGRTVMPPVPVPVPVLVMAARLSFDEGLGSVDSGADDKRRHEILQLPECDLAVEGGRSFAMSEVGIRSVGLLKVQRRSERAAWSS